jgi:hypothetical protein
MRYARRRRRRRSSSDAGEISLLKNAVGSQEGKRLGRFERLISRRWMTARHYKQDQDQTALGNSNTNRIPRLCECG